MELINHHCTSSGAKHELSQRVRCYFLVVNKQHLKQSPARLSWRHQGPHPVTQEVFKLPNCQGEDVIIWSRD